MGYDHAQEENNSQLKVYSEYQTILPHIAQHSPGENNDLTIFKGIATKYLINRKVLITVSPSPKKVHQLSSDTVL